VLPSTGSETTKGPAPQPELPSEAEYYSFIAGEVSRLPHNTHLARQALYDRMWVTIAAQRLHKRDAPASDPQSDHLAFQRAICKVEVEMALQGKALEKEQVKKTYRRRPF
jgi:hypothetical protein